ncbi:MAG: hypothetical protein P1S60_15225 [Anaerolineae bacterium]|nr:hypothetical protein [Anaerolineae bacterium]
MNIDELLLQDSLALAERNIDTIAIGLINDWAGIDRQVTQFADSGQLAQALDLVNHLIERCESHSAGINEAIYYLSGTLAMSYMRKMLILKKKRQSEMLDAEATHALLEDYLATLDKILALEPYMPQSSEDLRQWTGKVLTLSRSTRDEIRSYRQ